MDSRVAKQRWLQKQFQTSGIQLEPAALGRLVSVIDDVDKPEELVQTLLDEIEGGFDERRVTAELLDKLLVGIVGSTGRPNTSTSNDGIQIIDAYSSPYIMYDPIRKLFRKSEQPRAIHADIKSKLQLYVDRFLIIQQRIKRNKMFRPVQWSSLGRRSARAETSELTELKALLGLVGERRYVLGFLTRQDEGRYFIEDMSTRLPLDLTEAETADGLFTENCIVVAEGELTASGAFKALALGLPPAEPRTESLNAMQGLDFFGGKNLDARDEERWRSEYEDDRVVVLSDVWLDRPDIMDKLHLIFEGYSGLEHPPSVFVLMGNFQSYDANSANVHYGRIKDNFAALGRLINQFPAIRATCRFLLVPGPGDVGPGNVLPRPPLPRTIASALLDAVPNAILGSNPCRVRHGNSDLVLFRADLQHKMRGLAILPHSTGEAPLFEQLCATVLQEAHLFPVPLEYQPIVWEQDHAMYLYPMPDGLVLADSEAAATHTFDTCSCFNPGSLASGTFAAWNPVTGESELCDALPPSELSDQEDEEGAVEFEVLPVGAEVYKEVYEVEQGVEEEEDDIDEEEDAMEEDIQLTC